MHQAIESKLDEDTVEDLCIPNQKHGRWLSKLDIVDEPDGRLHVEEMGVTGECRSECSTVLCILLVFSHSVRCRGFIVLSSRFSMSSDQYESTAYVFYGTRVPASLKLLESYVSDRPTLF